MFAFKINDKEVKYFMNKLFKENTFDYWEIRGLDIIVFTRFQVSGALEIKTDEEEKHKFSTWSELKPYAFNIIKGAKRPKFIKIIFSLPENKVSELHQNAAAFFLNMTFENDEITFTAANSEKVFSMDKSINNIWEDYIKKFFKENGIVITL